MTGPDPCRGERIVEFTATVLIVLTVWYMGWDWRRKAEARRVEQIAAVQEGRGVFVTDDEGRIEYRSSQ